MISILIEHKNERMFKFINLNCYLEIKSLNKDK